MNERLAFIDWMKVIGMGLIVWGHTGSDALIRPTEPFNPKQLGVAFFIFVLGYSLARETRPSKEVIFNRLFPIFVVGLSIAAVLSVVEWIRVGDLRESNYLPFVLGINVFFDFFPANPTTWFIGTYIHIILLWVLLRRSFQINSAILLAIFVVEVLSRALIINHVGSYVAYMLITNWITVLAIGLFLGQKSASSSPTVHHGAMELGRLLVFIAVWTLLGRLMAISKGFPFSTIIGPTETLSVLITSAAVSSLYVLVTLMLFYGTLSLPHSRGVQLFARNTTFVFIVHMPMVYAICPLYYPYVPSLFARIPINCVLFYIVPTICSEILFRFINLRQLRDSAYQGLRKRLVSGRDRLLQNE